MLHDNKKFKSLIKNKKVCIVGPSPDLQDIGAGPFIDGEFDTIIRTNGSIDIPEESYHDYGSQTTIAYLNNYFLNSRIKEADKLRDLLQLLNDDVKMVVLKGDGTVSFLKKACKQFKIKNCAEFDKTSYAFKKTPDFWLKNLKGKNKSIYEPTLVSYILSDVIHFNPKLLYITGVNFYSSATHWANYYNEGVSQKRQSIERGSQHHIKGDMEYVRHVCNTYPNVRPDPILRSILTD